MYHYQKYYHYKLRNTSPLLIKKKHLRFPCVEYASEGFLLRMHCTCSSYNENFIVSRCNTHVLCMWFACIVQEFTIYVVLHALRVHCVCVVHCACVVHALCTHCACIVHVLCKRCAYIVHASHITAHPAE